MFEAVFRWILNARGSQMTNRRMFNYSKHEQARNSFDRGNEAMINRDWEQSCERFRECVDLVPENLLYRQSLRGATEKKYRNNGSGAKSSDELILPIRVAIDAAKEAENWTKVADLCEDGLAINPWDTRLNSELAYALIELEYPEPALYSLERAVRRDFDNVELLMTAASLYQASGKYAAAEEMFKRVLQLDRGNLDALRGLAELEDRELPPLDVLFSLEPSEELSLAQILKEIPDESHASLSLSNTRTIKTANSDLSASRQQQIEACVQELKVSPHDLTRQFKLGLLYQEGMQYSRAIPLFQATRQDHRYRLESLMRLGKCFLSRRQMELALFEFESALDIVGPNESDERHIEIMYYIERLRRYLRNSDTDFDPKAPVMV